jgi:hypothetical protein
LCSKVFVLRKSCCMMYDSNLRSPAPRGQCSCTARGASAAGSGASRARLQAAKLLLLGELLRMASEPSRPLLERCPKPCSKLRGLSRGVRGGACPCWRAAHPPPPLPPQSHLQRRHMSQTGYKEIQNHSTVSRKSLQHAHGAGCNRSYHGSAG